jgi:predicted transposase/invertase (TIGR01784 family)
VNTAKREGHQEGLEQGFEQGFEKGQIEIARNLLDVLDDQTISEKTGLPIEEVQKLRS